MASFKDTLGKKATALGKNKLGIDSGFGELSKLKIGKNYTSILNPTDISHKFSVSYAQAEKAAPEKETEKDEKGNLKVASSGPETLSFTLLMDGTGVTGTIVDVSEEIQWLSQAVYHELKEGETQEEVTITWGKTINFTGNIENFDLAYSLFDPQGNPLRARVSMTFVGRSKLTKITKQPDRKSNTQVVDIKDSDKLSVVCKSIYNSPLTYIAVAKANKLTNVRKLKPGTKLTFPPKKS